MFVRAIVLFSLSTAIVAAQQCAVQAGGTPSVRSNGQAELVGDVIIACTGGTPVQAPHVIPATDITLRFNVPVTSKVIAPGATEALMFYNDPAPAAQHPCTVGACTNHAGVPFGPGANENKNVFAARTGTNNREIIFVDTPVDYSSSGITLIRLTNLRVDASALGVGPGGQATIEVSITSTVSGADGSTYPLTNPDVVLGVATNPAIVTPLDGALLTLGTNIGLNDPVSSTTPLTARYRFRESFPSAFKKRSSSNDPAVPAAQNLPGAVLQVETGFYNPAFPTAESLNIAGLANTGTRLMLQFVNVPAGVSLYAPVRLEVRPASGGNAPPGFAQLVNSDANGAGAYSPVNATTTIANGLQVAQLAVTNGTAVATWELTATDTVTLEEVIAGFAVSYPAGITGPNTMRVIPLLAPLTVPFSQAAPRFAPPLVPDQMSLHFSSSLSIAGPPLATAARGRTYNQALQAARGTAPFQWEYSGGTLPAGLTLQPNGVIAGVPLNAGSFNFTARVTDGTGATADSPPLNITVVNPPVFGALPPASVDRAYIVPVPVTASTAYNLVFESGTLPPGVTYSNFSKSLIGFPSQAGTFNFRLRAIDLYGFETAADLAIGVIAPTGQPLLTSPDTATTLSTLGVTVSWTPVPGAAVYEARVIQRTTSTPQAGENGPIVFFLPLPGQTTAFAGLPIPPRSSAFFIFEAQVRACFTLARTNCTPFSRRLFFANPPLPTTEPAKSSSVSGSLVTMSWNPVNGVSRYEVEVVKNGQKVYRISPGAGNTSTIASLPSGTYDWFVYACTVRCNPIATAARFTITLPPVPLLAPANTQAQVTGPNTMTVSWQTVQNADIYEVQLVQPGAGPGGGALTVASARTNALSANLAVPAGIATAFVRGCNGDGCGPYAQISNLNVPGPNPAAPVVSAPLTGQNVAGPVVFFAWSRIPGDNGSNTTYRVYVQDLSRQAAALDALTTNNFFAAYLQAEGTRYDVLVIANPGTAQQVQSAAVGFNVQGSSALAPTMAAPTHMSKQPQGPTFVGWTPVPGAQLYEFYLEAAGAPPLRGASSALIVQVPLTPVGGVLTRYNGIVRACPAGATCVPEQDAGWSPWSNIAGSGVTSFDIQP